MDDDKMYNIETDAARLKEVGEISVWVYRQSDVQQIGSMGNRRDQFGLKEDTIHEKALKGQAKSHTTV
jgi:hypothetical protein